ncbi:hypothetical protein [Flammeovirga kamogawensis]|uniref:Uncharacterized protein n=1 Tax=Flammeovirga kamogawensis TaxID=373891 RepID=A0ABX8H352_9BACT|nr:hypothetical protein [Flammeovirga kamogawensis]MBB6463115.1 putative membrane protein [Flammeovirga kamogawensis]QWG10351.1 hypothetical protein KM029_25585 [Flammeovirga kamogawensis]TRX63860.1 hypothetical protein EO216_25955 [Flammeovirga kamogawensis]
MQYILSNLNDFLLIILFLFLVLVLHGVINFSKISEEKLKEYKAKKMSYVFVWGGLIVFTLSLFINIGMQKGII